MKTETVQKANSILKEIDLTEKHLEDLAKFKGRAEMELESGGKHTLAVRIHNPANSSTLILVDEMDIPGYSYP